MHMEEGYATNIAKRKVEASVCEAEKESINAQEVQYYMDVKDDGETHYATSICMKKMW